MSAVNDSELMRLIRDGDEAAASALYHRYIDAVHRIAWRILLDENLAKDCAQDVWIKVFQNAHRFKPDGSFRAWVSSIAARTAIDLCRKRGKMPTAALDEEGPVSLASLAPNGRDRAEEARLRGQIMDELNRLSAPQRAAFILRHFEGASLAEISRALHCSEGTVKTHIHRALKAVRKALSHYAEEGKQPCLENG